MAKDLTTCQVDRQNILNNELAITELQKQTGIQGVVFEERLRFTKAMVATYFDVDERTIERYVSDNTDEITSNGYEIIKGARLKAFIKCIAEQDVPDINVGNILFSYTFYKCFQPSSFDNLISVRSNFISIITYIPFNCSFINIKICSHHGLSKPKTFFKNNSLYSGLFL